MRDALTEGGLARVILVDMDRIEIAGQTGKQHEVGFADGLGKFRALADLEEGFDTHVRLALFTAPPAVDRDATTAAAAACWRCRERASSIRVGIAAHPSFSCSARSSA